MSRTATGRQIRNGERNTEKEHRGVYWIKLCIRLISVHSVLKQAWGAIDWLSRKTEGEGGGS